MIKKGSILIIAILFISMAALGYFLQQKKKAYVASPYGTIPMDAGILIEAINMPAMFETLVEGNEIISEMSVIPELKRFTSSLYLIDSLIRNREYRTFIRNNPVLISIHLLGKDRLTPFFSFAVPHEIRVKHIKEALDGVDGYRYSVKEYQGSNVFELVSSANARPLLFISFSQGVLTISPSELLIEAGIRQMDEEINITKLPGFANVSSAAGKNESKIYLVFPNVAKIVALLTGGADKGIASVIPKLASCAEADIYMRRNGFMLSGYIEAGDTSQVLYKYSLQEPGTYDSYRNIPAGVAMFEILTSLPTLSVDKNDDDMRYITDLLKPQLTGECTRLYLDIQGQDAEKNKLIMFELKGRNATEKAFREEVRQMYERKDLEEEDYLIRYKPDDETEYLIYILPEGTLGDRLGGDFGAYISAIYATFYDNLLVLSSTPATLTKFIYDNILNRTLANDLTYRDFESTMPSRAGYYFYCIPSKIIPVLKDVFKEDIVKGLERNISSLRKIQAVGYQFVSSNDMIYNTLSVSYKSDVKEHTTALWESMLDTVAFSKPLFFINHYTGRNEIFIQDMNSNVYLINSAGRILWKRPLPELMKGDAYIIDYYKNGKFQILFATTNYLYMIDRNGNNVEKYPVRMRAPASNGLALFDYDNNKDYRLFICGTDRIVYAYDKTGSTVKGWQQYKTTGIVFKDVEFFRVSGKDYLVLNDENNMYILDRRGSPRVNVKEQISRSKGSGLSLTSGSSPRIVLASKDGSLNFISFNGDVETYTLHDFSEDPVFEYFDIDADGYGEYIYIDHDRMYAYDNDRSRMFVKSLGSERIIGPFGLVFSSNDKKIGYVDAENDLIYLLDSNGKIVNGFPLNGSTSFSAGKLNRGSNYNLVTGGRDSFIYNYEITR